MPVRSDWTDWQPGLTLFGLCLLPLLLPNLALTWLEYRRQAILAGELWRLLSAHFVHFSSSHAVMDGLTCLILASGLRRMDKRRGILLRLAILAVAISLALMLLAPTMEIYRGASGLAVALAAALGLALWRQRPNWRPVLALLTAALVISFGTEASGIRLLPSSLPAEVSVAWQAHAAGFLFGLLAWHDTPCRKSAKD